MPTSFGQVIPVLGTNLGFAGNVSRIGDRVIVSRQVLPTTLTNLLFGAAAVLIPDAAGGKWQSVADFIAANPANAASVVAQFAGVAVREVKTMLQYTQFGQSTGTVVNTTGTASSGSTSLTVASATGIAVGQSVEGAGVQPGTVASAVSGTTVTLSLPVTAALSGTTVSFTSSISQVTGYYSPSQIADVLERGNITVPITNGTPQAGSPVYIRTAVNPSLGATSVGDFEAAADTPVTTTATGSSGSATLTPASMTGIALGQFVNAAGVPANTVVIAVGASTITISQNTTAALSTTAISFVGTTPVGSAAPYGVVFRTGAIDGNGIAEITIRERRAA